MSIRTRKIASTLRAAIQTSIGRGIHDPRIRGLVTVVSVEVAPDLSEAYIGISVFPEEHAKLTLSGLTHAARKIRTELSRTVRLRKMPRLIFRLDDSLKRHAQIADVLQADSAHRSERSAGSDEKNVRPPHDGESQP